MQKSIVALTDEERKSRRLESARIYREKNREKCVAASTASRAKKPEQYKEKQKEYRERSADKIKIVSVLYRDRNRSEINASSRQWQVRNLEKFSAYQSEYRKKNSDSEKNRSSLWRRSNPERESARKSAYAKSHKEQRRLNEIDRRSAKKFSGGKLSRDIHERLIVLQKGKCACCKNDLSKIGYHLDHIIPLSKNGRHSDENIQLLCPPCNLSKSAKHPVDFMQQRGFLL